MCVAISLFQVIWFCYPLPTKDERKRAFSFAPFGCCSLTNIPRRLIDERLVNEKLSCEVRSECIQTTIPSNARRFWSNVSLACVHNVNYTSWIFILCAEAFFLLSHRHYYHQPLLLEKLGVSIFLINLQNSGLMFMSNFFHVIVLRL